MSVGLLSAPYISENTRLIMEFSDNRVWLQIAKKKYLFSFYSWVLRDDLSIYRLLPCPLVVWDVLFCFLFYFGFGILFFGFYF